jgi:hypothetical protein
MPSFSPLNLNFVTMLRLPTQNGSPLYTMNEAFMSLFISLLYKLHGPVRTTNENNMFTNSTKCLAEACPLCKLRLDRAVRGGDRLVN